MSQRYDRFFDSFVWTAIILFDAVMMINFVATGWLTVQVLGGRHGALAIVGVAYWLTYVPASPLAARLGARIGLRRVAVLGATLLPITALLLTRADSLAAVFATMALLGLGGGAFWPNIEAELSRGRQGVLLRKRLSVFNTMWCAGTILGPLVGSLLYPSEQTIAGPDGRQAINAVFYAGIVLGLATVACVALWRNRLPTDAEVADHIRIEPAHGRQLLRTFMRMSFIANFMAHLVVTTMRQLFEGLAHVQWQGRNATDRHFWLLVALATAGTAMFALLFHVHGWSYRLKRFIAFQAMLAAGLLAATLTDNLPTVLAGFVVIGLANSFIYSGSLFYSIEGTDESTHMAGWHEAVLGSGSICGLLLPGYVPTLLKVLGVPPDWPLLIRTPYLAVAAMCVGGIGLQLAIYARSRRAIATATPQPTPR
jgi:MFS family permease